MPYTKTSWASRMVVNADRLNNAESQYNYMKNEWGTIQATTIVAASTSYHKAGADYLCDGVEDHIQIQAAIDEAAGYGGGIVLLLEGTYTLGSWIKMKDNVTLRGMGGGTIIKLMASYTWDVYIITNDDWDRGNHSFSVENLTVDGNRANQTTGNHTGISFLGCVGVDYKTISHVRVQNCTSNAIVIGRDGDNNSCANVLIDGCSVSNCYDGIWVHWSQAVNVSDCSLTSQFNFCGIFIKNSSDCIVEGNVVRQQTAAGNVLINIGGDARHNIVSGNYLNGGGFVTGIQCEDSGFNAVIIGNNITGCTNGINIITVGDVCYNNVLKANNQSIRVFFGAKTSGFSVIVGNISDLTNTDDGIDVSGACNDVIVGNCFYRSRQRGMNIQNADDNVIGANVVLYSSREGNLYDQLAVWNDSDRNSVIFNSIDGNDLPKVGLQIYGANCDLNLVTGNFATTSGTVANMQDTGTGTDKTWWHTTNGGNH